MLFPDIIEDQFSTFCSGQKARLAVWSRACH